MADIEIDLSNIDYSQIPGYTPITAAVPNWKRDMIEKKNQEKLEEYIEHLKRQEMALRRRKAEEEKWKNVPEWKRKILMEKAAQKAEQDEAFDADQEEERQRREEKRRQIEAQMDAEEDEGEIPQWKKEIMLKRGGVPKNWGDEREEINEAE